MRACRQQEFWLRIAGRACGHFVPRKTMATAPQATAIYTHSPRAMPGESNARPKSALRGNPTERYGPGRTMPARSEPRQFGRPSRI